MRKNFGAKTYLYPQPVLIICAYDENKNANAMNAAWGGICDYQKLFICMSAEHKTTKNILKRKAFSVSIADKKHVIESDYLGIVSGNQEPRKIQNAGLHLIESTFVDAPIIEEYPLTLECELESYDEKKEILIGKIINVSADEKILTEDKIDPLKLEPITYDAVNHQYIQLGTIVGKAFTDGLKLKK